MLGAIERAERVPRKHFVERADKELDAHGALMRIRPGAPESYPNWFRGYVELEAEAHALHDFQADAVPGLFQTKEYAAAVLHAGWPPSGERQVEHLLKARMARQKLLRRDPLPLLWVVIDESVLRRPVGSPEVMFAQLDHLVKLGSMPQVRLQVLPFAKGPHAAMDGSFKVLDMSDGERLAYAEVPGSGRVITDAAEVEKVHAGSERFSRWRFLRTSPQTSSLDTRRHTAMASTPFDWHKSSYSGNQGGDCVEIAETSHQVHIRDTQNRALGHLTFSSSDWGSLLASLREGHRTD